APSQRRPANENARVMKSRTLRRAHYNRCRWCPCRCSVGTVKREAEGRGRSRRTPNLRCPRNGTADEVANAASALAHEPLKALAFGKVVGVAPSARIPANRGSRARRAAERR